MAAPQPPIRFPATADSLLAAAKKAIETSREAQDDLVAKIKSEDATFDNTMRPLMKIESDWTNQYWLLQHPKDVTEDAELRKACKKVYKMISEYAIESGMREDIFKLVQAVVNRGEVLGEQSEKCLEDTHKLYLKQGLALDAEKRIEFETLAKKIKEICAQCKTNFIEDKSGIWLTRDELNGLPSKHIESLKHEDGKSWLTLKRADFEPAMKYVKDPAVRKRIQVAQDIKMKINAPLVKELYGLRNKAARLLGYKNHSDLKVDGELFAGSPAFARSFLNEVHEKLTPAGKRENKILAELKRRDGYDEPLSYWDSAYYTRVLAEEQGIDEIATSEYFPLPSMLQGMIHIFNRIFGVTFKKLDLSADIKDGYAELLHKDTMAYEVWGPDFLGHLYLDLYPRNNKLAHPTHLGIQRGPLIYPSSVVMCSFTKPLSDRPSLLRHSEAKTFFHEFGHAIHNLVSKAEYVIHSGTRCARDFSEAPSKMLENWFWEPEVLREITEHWSYVPGYEIDARPPRRMPEDMIKKVVQSRYLGFAGFELRQIALAVYDLEIHTEDIEDPQALYNNLMYEYGMLEPRERESYRHAHFSHMWGCYAASYYGYILATAIGADMYWGEPFSKEGLRYRRMILEPGGSIPAKKMLEEYLGRSFSIQRWIESVGIAD